MDSSQGKSLTWIHHFTFLGLKSSFAKGGLGKEKEYDLKYSKSLPPLIFFEPLKFGIPLKGIRIYL